MTTQLQILQDLRQVTSGAEGRVDLHRRAQYSLRDRVVQHEKEGLRVLVSSVVERFLEDSQVHIPVLIL
jgi:hypothetical protein